MENQQQTETFSLGITMAGAVSAGCYTAGVMDYLFEILDLWEKAKKKEILTEHFNKIPQHCVRIDAMGGTSAGGMTTTMSAIYALNGVINPVKKPEKLDEPKDNILYDNWVLMGETDENNNVPLIEKLLDLDDLENGIFNSILNSKFIDEIAENAFLNKSGYTLPERVKNLPSYISKDLQLLLSHCFLRGIPLDVDFETPISKSGRKSVIPNHSTFEHYVVSQYHLNSGIEPNFKEYLWLNPYEQRYSDILKLSTIATGAFPIGLAFREFTPDHLNEAYLKTTLKRIITGEFGKDNPKAKNIDLNYLPKKYSSIAIDGGAINNEPYREILSILEHQNVHNINEQHPMYGIIMIDPFPDRAQLLESYSKPNDAIDVAKEIIGTLMDQSRIKRREMLESDPSRYFRSIIFPRKWKTDKQNNRIGPPDTIACASAMAFGGFLDKRFRQHDFFLGRNNTRNFIRFFFSFPYDPVNNDVHPIHKNWTDEMIEAFRFKKNEKYYLPIIPDLYLLLEDEAEREAQQKHYDIPETPFYDPELLFKLEGKLKKRFIEIFNVLQKRDFSDEIKEAKIKELKTLTPRQKESLEKAQVRNQIAEDWIEKKYSQNWLYKCGLFIVRPFIILGIFIGKRVASKKIARTLISEIIKDLAARGLIKQEIKN